MGITARGKGGFAVAFACAVAFAWALALCGALTFAVAPAFADDELASVKGEIADKTAELEALTEEATATEKRIAEIDADMERTLENITQLQEEHARVQAELADLARALYKHSDDVNALVILVNSDSWMDLLERLELREKLFGQFADLSEEQEREAYKLDLMYKKASQDKTAKGLLLSEQRKRQEQLDDAIDDLKLRERQLTAEQQVLLAQAAAAAHQIADTVATQDLASVLESGPGLNLGQWHVGLASAYGGSSDPSTPNPGRTATGALCDDWSVGVAVPMAWGPGAYYGRWVEISYGGQSFIATVNDCGGMNGGQRALDLQPGVFKAFGFSTCNDWGVRTVSYRFL